MRISRKKKDKRKRITYKRRQEGGEFVGQGSYGCAFWNRPLRCRGERVADNDYITKLLLASEARKEFAKKKLLEQIDPREEFLLFPHQLCEPQLPFVRDDMIHLCDKEKFINYKEGSHGYRDGLIVKYKFGGDNLSNTTVYLDEFPALMHGLLRLMKGINKMHRHKLYHCDIKFDNIVVENEGRAFIIRLIDFGISQHVIKEYKPENRLSINYAYWPYDTRFVVPIHPRFLANNNEENYYKANHNIDKFKGELEEYILHRSSVNIDVPLNKDNVYPFKVNIEAFVRERKFNFNRFILSRTDIYSFGIVLSQILFKVLRIYFKSDDEIFIIKGGNKFSVFDYTGDNKDVLITFVRLLVPIYKMIMEMTDVDPIKRGSLNIHIRILDAAIRQIDEYFYSGQNFKILSNIIKYVPKSAEVPIVRQMHSPFVNNPTPPITPDTGPGYGAPAPPIAPKNSNRMNVNSE